MTEARLCFAEKAAIVAGWSGDMMLVPAACGTFEATASTWVALYATERAR